MRHPPRRIEVRFDFPLVFTRGALDPHNRVLLEVITRREPDERHRVLFVVVTDGMENASVEFTLAQVRTAVERQRSAYKWQVQFIGADEAAWQGAELGMATMRYAKSARGTAAAYSVASAAISDYLIAAQAPDRLQMVEAIDENGMPTAAH